MDAVKGQPVLPARRLITAPGKIMAKVGKDKVSPVGSLANPIDSPSALAYPESLPAHSALVQWCLYP